jgi:hypothetical protein
MAETEDRVSPQPGPDAAEFAGIRADLSRLYMRHRLDLGLALASDNQRWKERYRWFFEAVAELQDALPGKQLDG